MPHTQLLFRDQARGKILAGASALADAVRVTLGPKSHCVLIERFDAARDAYTDVLEAGIVDPTQVVRLALENEQRAMPETEIA